MRYRERVRSFSSLRLLHGSGSWFRDSVDPCRRRSPWAPATVRITGVIGVALVATAVLLGLIALGFDRIPALDAARVALVFSGVVFAGSAISMRPELWWSWAIGAGASLLGVFGLPQYWDSFQLFFSVAAGAAAFGAALCLVSATWRYTIASFLILFHFTGIFMATTSPPVSPWLTDQLFRRIFNPYLQFVYLRNAYHFYSPEPGPASVLAYFLKTETGTDSSGEKRYKTQWVVLPTRPADIRDPMGLGYYRLLALNEQLARGSHSLAAPNDEFEKTEMWYRRTAKAGIIPYHPAEPQLVQYKLPSPDVMRFLLPSYTQHVILENTPDAETAARTTVMVYRLEHRNLPANQMGAGQSPYHPGTYRPYFLGEFDAWGHLVNPQAAMLYWMVPVVPRQPAPGDPVKKDYTDYLSLHALMDCRMGFEKVEDVLAADENAGVVFNWSKLR